MKIRILDENYLKENDLNEVVEYNNNLITKLDTNNINYEIGDYCHDCNEWVLDEYLIEVQTGNGTSYVCEDCIEEYTYCECCNNYYNEDHNTYTTYNGTSICEDCYDEYYATCPECNEIYPTSIMYYCNVCDAYLCSDCYDEHENSHDTMYDYHSFNDWQPHKTTTEPEPLFYIGHELEIDNGDYQNEACELIQTKVNGICMHDGSLSSYGIEFISHPLSYNYMLSLEEDYRDLFRELKNNFNYRSHDTNDCGLHFHVTRPQNSDIIDRIILFMETYKDEIIQISRRTHNELEHWANFISDRVFDVDKKEIQSIDFIKKHKDTSNRYMALNLTNTNTIEFRFFKGTLNYETFMADFEFIYNLVRFASDLSLPIEELTWTKVTSEGKFLPRYVEINGFKTDKPIKDYTNEIIEEIKVYNEKCTKLLDKYTRDTFATLKKNLTLKKNQKLDYDKILAILHKQYMIQEHNIRYIKTIINEIQNPNITYTKLKRMTDSIETLEREMIK